MILAMRLESLLSLLDWNTMATLSQHWQRAMIRLLLLLLGWSSLSHGHAVGAPEVQCQYMTPKHGFQPQIEPPFVTINVADVVETNQTLTLNNETPGTQVKVTLRSRFGHFRGFLMRADSLEGQTGLGTWWITSDIEENPPSQYLHCFGRAQSGITHTDWIFSRPFVTAFWQPPTNFSGQVRFRATVVEDFKTFWKDIVSPVISVVRPQTHPKGVDKDPGPRGRVPRHKEQLQRLSEDEGEDEEKNMPELRSADFARSSTGVFSPGSVLSQLLLVKTLFHFLAN